MKIIELAEVDSTNEYCKREDKGEDMIVTAARQAAGKGTKGRSFLSPEGGLYVSILRHFENFPSSEVFRIMVNTCVAVCRAVESVGCKPVIRWANDVLIHGKKVSGTLIENSFSGNKIVRSIVGVGVNVNNKLPAELDGIATSLSESRGKPVDFGAFRDCFTEFLQKNYTVEEYKSYMPWLGSQVLLNTAQGVCTVRAEDVADDGRLIVADGSQKRWISAAEVSLRLL